MSDETRSDQELLDGYTRFVRDAIPLLHAMDLRVVGVARGTAAVEIPEDPNKNHAGMLYAGSLFSAAEVLGGLIPGATWPGMAYIPIVAGLEISFLRPARGRIRAEATLSEAEIARVEDEMLAEAPKIRFDLRASLTAADGAEVAATVGQYQLRRIEGIV